VNWKKILESFARYALIILLVFNIYGSVFILFFNLESYFFGEKLVVANSIIYLLIGDIAGATIVCLLFMKKGMGEILSVIYFGYFFIESLMTNLSLGFGFLVSPLFKLGLVISIALLVIRKMIYQ